MLLARSTRHRVPGDTPAWSTDHVTGGPASGNAFRRGVRRRRQCDRGARSHPFELPMDRDILMVQSTSLRFTSRTHGPGLPSACTGVEGTSTRRADHGWRFRCGLTRCRHRHPEVGCATGLDLGHAVGGRAGGGIDPQETGRARLREHLIAGAVPESVQVAGEEVASRRNAPWPPRGRSPWKASNSASSPQLLLRPVVRASEPSPEGGARVGNRSDTRIVRGEERHA